MGTRGLIVLVIKKRIFSLYNHWDSYPSALGRQLIQELISLLEKHTMAELATILYNLVIVSNNIPPTPDEISMLKKYSDLYVSTCSLSDWYCLLRKCQGSLCKTIESGYANATEYDKIDDIDTRWVDYVYLLDFNLDKFYCNSKEISSLTNLNFEWISNSD